MRNHGMGIARRDEKTDAMEKGRRGVSPGPTWRGRAASETASLRFEGITPAAGARVLYGSAVCGCGDSTRGECQGRRRETRDGEREIAKAGSLACGQRAKGRHHPRGDRSMSASGLLDGVSSIPSSPPLAEARIEGSSKLRWTGESPLPLVAAMIFVEKGGG